jgi:hypothetical protein
MQTFIVHNRNAKLFLADIGWRNFLFFEIYVGGLILSSLLHTVFVLSLLGRGILFGLWPGTSTAVEIAYLAILVLGYLGTVVLVIAGLVRRRAWELIPLQAVLPFYWAMHSVASLQAAYQLITRPYFWGKTTHGKTKQMRTFVRRETRRAIGDSARATGRRSRSPVAGR